MLGNKNNKLEEMTMEQAIKLFQGCPYEEQESLRCNQCPQYKRCLEKKKRRKKRKLKYILSKILPKLLIAIFAIAVVVILVICANSKENDDVTMTSTTSMQETSSTVDDSNEEPKTTVIEEPTEEDSPTEEAVMEEEEVPKEDSELKEEDDSKEDSNLEEDAVPEKMLSADGPGEVYYYNVSEEDKVLMAKLVWKEARGEPLKGKVAVAAVILNRYCYGEDRDFKRESIESVITQPGQFASIKNVTMADLDLVPECMEAVEAACKGWDPTRECFSQGALYFYAHDSVSGYQKEIRQGLKIMVIQNHSFHFNFEKVR